MLNCKRNTVTRKSTCLEMNKQQLSNLERMCGTVTDIIKLFTTIFTTLLHHSLTEPTAKKQIIVFLLLPYHA